MKKGLVLVLFVIMSIFSLNVGAIDFVDSISVEPSKNYICASDCDTIVSGSFVSNSVCSGDKWVERTDENFNLCTENTNSCIFLENSNNKIPYESNSFSCWYEKKILEVESILDNSGNSGLTINKDYFFNDEASCTNFCDNYNGQNEFILNGSINIENSAIPITSTNAKIVIGPHTASITNGKYEFNDLKYMPKAKLQVLNVGTKAFEPLELELEIINSLTTRDIVLEKVTNLLNVDFQFQDKQKAFIIQDGLISFNNFVTSTRTNFINKNSFSNNAFKIETIKEGIYNLTVKLNGFKEKVFNNQNINSDSITLENFEIETTKDVIITVQDSADNSPIYDVKINFENNYFASTNLTGEVNLKIPSDKTDGVLTVSKDGYISQSLNYVDFDLTITLTKVVPNICDDLGGILYSFNYLKEEEKTCKKSKLQDIDKKNIISGTDNNGNTINNPDSDTYICCEELTGEDFNLDKLIDSDDDGVNDYLDVCPFEPLITSQDDKYYTPDETLNIFIDEISDVCSDTIDNDCDNHLDSEDNGCTDPNTIPPTVVAPIVDYECCNTQCSGGLDYSGLANDVCSNTAFTCNIGACSIVAECVESKTFGDIVKDGLPIAGESSCSCGTDIYDYESRDLAGSCCIDGILSTECVQKKLFSIEMDFYEDLAGLTDYTKEVELFIKPTNSNIQITKPFVFEQHISGSNRYIISGLEKLNYIITIFAEDKQAYEFTVSNSNFADVDNDNDRRVISRDVILESISNGECSEREPEVIFNVTAIKSVPNALIEWKNPCTAFNETGLITHYIIRRTSVDAFNIDEDDYDKVSSKVGEFVFPTDVFSETVAIIENNEFEKDGNGNIIKDIFGKNIYKNEWSIVDNLDEWGIDENGNRNSYLYEIRALYVGNRMSAFSLPHSVNDFRKLFNFSKDSFTNNTDTNLNYLKDSYSLDNVYNSENVYIDNIKSKLITNDPSFAAAQGKYLDNLKYKFFSSGSNICTYFENQFCAEYLDDDLKVNFDGILNDVDFNFKEFVDVLEKKLEFQTLKSNWAINNFAELFLETNNLKSIPSVIVSCNDFNFPQRIDSSKKSVCGYKKFNNPLASVCAINNQDTSLAECIQLPDLMNNPNGFSLISRQDVIKENLTGAVFKKQETYNEKKAGFNLLEDMGSDTNIYTTFDKGSSVFDKWFSCTDSLIDDSFRKPSCYGYKSEEACNVNVCGYGGDESCTWVEDGFLNVNSDLSIGYCKDSEPLENNCDLCNTGNDIYGYGNCTQNVCSDLGDCYSRTEVSTPNLFFTEDSDFLSCETCSSNTKCSDYATEFACTGEDVSLSDSILETADPFSIQDTTDTISINLNSNKKSADACGIGSCIWNGTICGNDNNGDNVIDEIETNKKLNSHLLINNSKTYKINVNSWPSGFSPHKDSYSFTSLKERDGFVFLSTIKNGLVNFDETNSFVSFFKFGEDDYNISNRNDNKNLLRFDDIELESDDLLQNITYFSFNDENITELMNDESIFIDNTKSKINITINLLNGGGGPYDIKILRSSNEQIFDNLGNPNTCKDTLEKQVFGTDVNLFFEPVKKTDLFNVNSSDYEFNSVLEYTGLPKGIFKFNSLCYDLAGNKIKQERWFVLEDDTYIKSRYPAPGIYKEPRMDFGVELFRNAKECVYNLEFRDEFIKVNSNTINNLFNKEFEWTETDYVNEVVSNPSDEFIVDSDCVTANTNLGHIKSNSCINSDGFYYLNSTYSTASYSNSGLDVTNFKEFRSGRVLVNATCLVQNGTQSENFVEKSFIVTSYFIDQMPPETKIITSPPIDNNLNHGWINRQNLLDNHGNLIIGFVCEDKGASTNGISGCMGNTDFQINDYNYDCGNTFRDGIIESEEGTLISSSSTICFRSKDVLENVEDIKSVKFQIDSDLPEINLTKISGVSVDDFSNHDLYNYLNTNNEYTLTFDLEELTTNLSHIEIYNTSSPNGDFAFLKSKYLNGVKSASPTFYMDANVQMNKIKVIVYDYAGNTYEKIYNLFYDKTIPEFTSDLRDTQFVYGENISFDISFIDNVGWGSFENVDVKQKLEIEPLELYQFESEFTDLTSFLDNLNNYISTIDFSERDPQNYSEYGFYNKTPGDVTFNITPHNLEFGVYDIIPGIYNITITLQDEFNNMNKMWFVLEILKDSTLVKQDDLKLTLLDSDGSVKKIVGRDDILNYKLNSSYLLHSINKFETSLKTHNMRSAVQRDYNSFDSEIISNPNHLLISGAYQTPKGFNGFANIETDLWGVPIPFNNSNFYIEFKDIFETEYSYFIDNEISIDMKAPENFNFVPNMESTIEIYSADGELIRYRGKDNDLFNNFGIITNKNDFIISGIVDNYLTKPEIFYKYFEDSKYKTNILTVNEPNLLLDDYDSVIVDDTANYFKKPYFNINAFDETLVNLYFDIVGGENNLFFNNQYINYPQILSEEEIGNGFNLTFDNIVQTNDFGLNRLNIYSKPNRSLSFVKEFDLRNIHSNSLAAKIKFDEVHTTFHFDLKANDSHNNRAGYLSTNDDLSEPFKVTYDPQYPVVEISSPKEGNYFSKEFIPFNFTVSDNLGIESMLLTIYNKTETDDDNILYFQDFSKTDLVPFDGSTYLLKEIGESILIDDGLYYYDFIVKDVAGNNVVFENVSFNVVRSAPIINKLTLNGNKVSGVEYINNIKSPDLILELEFDNPAFEFVYNISNVQLIDLDNNDAIINDFKDSNGNNQYNISYFLNDKDISSNDRIKQNGTDNLTFYIDYRNNQFDFSAKSNNEILSEGRYKFMFEAEKGLSFGFGQYDFGFSDAPVKGIYSLEFTIDNTDPDIDLYDINPISVLNFELMGLNKEKNLMNVEPVRNITSINYYNILQNDEFRFQTELNPVVNNNEEIMVEIEFKLIDKALNEKNIISNVLYDLKKPNIDFNYSANSGLEDTIFKEDELYYTIESDFDINIKSDENILSSIKIFDNSFEVENIEIFTVLDDDTILTGKQMTISDFVTYRDYEDINLTTVLSAYDKAGNYISDSSSIIIDNTAPIISDFKPLFMSELRPVFKFNTNEFANCSLGFEKPLSISKEIITAQRISDPFNKSHEFSISNDLIEKDILNQFDELNVDFNINITCADKRGNEDSTIYLAKFDSRIPEYDVKFEKGTCINNDYCSGFSIKKYQFESGDIVNNQTIRNLEIYDKNKDLECAYLDLNDFIINGANKELKYSDDFEIKTFDFNYATTKFAGNTHPYTIIESDPHKAFEIDFNNYLYEHILSKRIIFNSSWNQFNLDKAEIIMKEDFMNHYLINCKDNAGNYAYPKVVKSGVDFDSEVGIYFDSDIYTNQINYDLTFLTRKKSSCSISSDDNLLGVTSNNNNIDEEYEHNFNVDLSTGDGLYEFDIECSPEIEDSIISTRGTDGSAVYSINLDTVVPKINLLSQKDLTTFSFIYNLIFNISENASVKINNINSQTFNNIHLEKDQLINYDFPLAYGTNYINIIAKDKAGNEGKEQILIHRLNSEDENSAYALIEYPGDGALISKLNKSSAIFVSDSNSRPINITSSLLYIKNMNSGQIYGDSNSEVCELDYTNKDFLASGKNVQQTIFSNDNWTININLTPQRIYREPYNFENMVLYGEYMDFYTETSSPNLYKDILQIEFVPKEHLILNNIESNSFDLFGQKFELLFNKNEESNLYSDVGFSLDDVKVIDSNPYQDQTLFKKVGDSDSYIEVKSIIDGVGNTVVEKMIYSFRTKNNLRLKKGDLLSVELNGGFEKDNELLLLENLDIIYNGLQEQEGFGVDDPKFYREYYLIDSGLTKKADLIKDETYNISIVNYFDGCSNVEYSGGTMYDDIVRKELTLNDLPNGDYAVTAVPLDVFSKPGIAHTILVEVDDTVPEIIQILPENLFLNNKVQTFKHKINTSRAKSASYDLNKNGFNPSNLITQSKTEFVHKKDLNLVNGINTFNLKIENEFGKMASTGDQIFLVNDNGFDNPNIIFSNLNINFNLNSDCQIQCRLDSPENVNTCMQSCAKFQNQELVNFLSGLALIPNALLEIIDN